MSKKDKEIERLNIQIEKIIKESAEKSEIKFQHDMETVMSILERYSYVNTQINYLRFGEHSQILTGREFTITFRN